MKQLFFGIKGLVINHEGKFLAVHKTKQKSPLLEIPGGRMEFGETIEETLVREMLEETNLRVTPKQVIATWNYIKKSGDFQVAGVIYLVETSDLSGLKLSEEHDSYCWLSFDELEHLVPHFETALKTVKVNEKIYKSL